MTLRATAPGLASLVAALAAVVFGASAAQAVVKGSSSGLGSYTVKLVGNGYCSGVVIARRLIVTAAHCGRGMRVVGRGGQARVIGVSRSAVLDDGRRVQVSGDAAILKLSAPLAGVSIAPVGPGSGDSFTIAGYGTTDERARGAFGSLHEARLVAATSRALVDPNRTGSIGASACFGDSGGPVMRGGELVGIITRAAHPSPRIACGHLTRWAPITVRGEPQPDIVTASYSEPVVEQPRRKRHRKARRERGVQVAENASFGLFRFFASGADTKPVQRKKRVRR
ncbi:MAG: trypsin-like serine protease [Pseudolabrys sp.]